jgi:hypothetical protein
VEGVPIGRPGGWALWGARLRLPVASEGAGGLPVMARVASVGQGDNAERQPRLNGWPRCQRALELMAHLKAVGGRGTVDRNGPHLHHQRGEFLWI